MLKTQNLLRNYLPALLVLLIHTVSLTACAQPTLHKGNERRLQENNKVAQSTVLLNNTDYLIPLTDISNMKIASVNLGSSFAGNFDSLLNKYTTVTSFTSTSYNSESLDLNDLSDDLKFFNVVIVQLTDQTMADPRTIGFLLDNQRNKQIIVTLSGNARSLKLLDAIHHPVIWTGEKSAASAEFVAQAIFGGTALSARLANSFSEKYIKGAGFDTKITRLKYSVPEEVGLNASDLNAIDDIAAEAIGGKAAPGAVVMVIKNGVVIFNKSYGSHTYDGNQPTLITDIFDLASITKISATTVSAMRLFEQNKLKLDTNIGAYIPKARKTDKTDISVREVMMHQAGFVPFIPFYKNMSPTDSSSDSSAAYPVKAADNYYMRRGYFDQVMWPQMLNSKMVSRGKYVYSDLSMYYMKEMIERQSGEHLENYVQNEFYKPLGMKTAGFNPRNRFSKEQIVPTEDDTYFRNTLLHGYVHDQGAAMVGGVSGHAGLFASANDLAIEYQMILNGGSYGGIQYFKPETVDMFTSKQSPVSRRGLGFDRFDAESKKGYPSALASEQTYGHTGYTGTCVWVDPKYDLVYIFLSNRVHPGVSEQLSKLNIRSRIQDVVYEAIKKAEPSTAAE